MTKENDVAFGLALASGVLLIISGISGAAMLSEITAFVKDVLHLGDLGYIEMVLRALIMLASLGGVIVIAGGTLIRHSRVRSGKILIALGTGMGIIGLVISLFIWLSSMSVPGLTFAFVLGLLGVILSVAARLKAKAAPARGRDTGA